MKKFIIYILLSTFIFAQPINNEEENLVDNSFITKFEYGAMLYANPRGVGCVL